jgi:peptidoglycan/LPS O-acetylase OafA/YrhL
LAAVAVVLHHIQYTEAKYYGLHSVMPGFLGHYDAGVDLFFVISGFIMVYIQPARISAAASYGRFIVHRFSRIYPPAWAVMLMLLPLWLARPQMFNLYYHHQMDIFRSFLILPQNYLPLLQVSWSLIHEVYFYFVISFALLFNPRGRWVFGLTWFLAVLAGFSCFGDAKFGGNRVLQLVFSPFSLIFLLGYFAGLSYQQIRKIVPGKALILLALGIVGLVVAVHFDGSSGPYPDNNHLFRLTTRGIPFALILVATLALEAYLPVMVQRMSYLGDISYAVYLVHYPIVACVYLAILQIGVQNRALLALVGGLCCLGCLAAGALFHWGLEMRLAGGCRALLERLLGLSRPKPTG